MKATKQGKGREGQAETTASVRASVSFPPELYQTLEEIAKQKRVSLAWVVRDAAEQYVTGKWPLLRGQG
jgi:metal-responsive CopG/Arc/MetJ family transcriptional regulator